MERSGAIKKLWSIIVGFIVILTMIFGICLLKQKQNNDHDANIYQGSIIVDLNEIERLTISEGETESTVKPQITELANKIIQHKSKSDTQSEQMLIAVYGVCMIMIIIIAMYLHFLILRPFQRMERFADEIAKGNFDTELKYERHQFFGAFTWAFDSMRKEIIKARSCEKEAIENNKMVIATLSHDIKTPIASIRAYSEAMESNMDTTIERRARYLKVIMRKCDEVTELTNDLFIHSISDLDKLVINKSRQQLAPVLEETIKELNDEKNLIRIKGRIDQAIAEIDRKRTVQVIGNIVGNAGKYAAGTEIEFWTAITDTGSSRNADASEEVDSEQDLYEIHIRDYGSGIAEEDLPFIFEKFYRGKNVSDYPGAGLGLYIVKYVMNQMDGDVELINHNDGLEVILRLPVLSE